MTPAIMTQNNTPSSFVRRMVGFLLILLPILYVVLLTYAEVTRPFKLSEAPDPEWIEPLPERVAGCLIGMILLYLPPMAAGLLLVFRRVSRPLVFFASLTVLLFSGLSFLTALGSELMRPSSSPFLMMGMGYFALGPALGIFLSLCLFFLRRPREVLLGFWLAPAILAIVKLLVL